MLMLHEALWWVSSSPPLNFSNYIYHSDNACNQRNKHRLYGTLNWYFYLFIFFVYKLPAAF